MVPSEQLCFAATTPGLEEVLAAEARLLGRPRQVPGGVELSGRPGLHQEACLRLRTANRVLLRLAQLPATANWGSAASALARVDLISVAAEGAPVWLESTVRRAGAPAAPVLRAWLARAWRRPVHPAAGEDRASGGTRLVLRLVEGAGTLSADASGELLYRRGYRQEVGRAPLRETLAAGLLELAGWRPSESLWDPLCGSGTLLVEAALHARRMAPGLNRAFAFEAWPGTDRAAWQQRRARAASEALAKAPAPIHGSDLNAGALGTARRNARRAGVVDSLVLARADVASFSPGRLPPGLILANLPYGKRVGSRPGRQAVFEAVGEALHTRFAGWRAALLTDEPSQLERAVGLPLEGAHRLHNGGIAVTLVRFRAHPPLPPG
ncbi:MAG: THUMP domain-containing class I SAM-dependent RNA methyltransferase [Myxococcaceae bacterium]